VGAGKGRLTLRTLILIIATLLTGCDPQLPSRVGAQAEELASITQRLTVLEGRISALEKTIQTQQESAGNWTLWQVTEAINAGYPQALSAYSSKLECLSAAGGWTFPGGKIVAQDPIIFQLKGYRVRLECLPVGTTPYAH
jgi:hypothetical protein